MPKKLTLQEFLHKARTKHGNKYNYDHVIYVNAVTKIKIYCCNCQKYFLQTPGSHLSGNGCPYCMAQTIGNKFRSSTAQFIEKAQKVHQDQYDYSEVNYYNWKTPVKIFCKHCQQYFMQIPNNHLRGKGCPYCTHSKGEKYIEKWLQTQHITYYTQYKFSDCKDKRPLPFDFYLPDHNLCIEYQGLQHYNPALFLMYSHTKTEGLQKFTLQQKRDTIKRVYCETHNINLLEIKYYEDIDKVLKEFL